MSSPNIPANITIQDIYDAIRPTWDVDGDIKDAVAKEFKKVTELQEDNERLQEELEGKEVLAKAYKEHKIEIMKLKEELKEEVKKTRFVSGMAVKKLAESCKEAIDGDITEAEKQIKHLKQKNKEQQEYLNKLVALSESTFNEYKEGFEDLKTLAQDKHDSLQTYINTLQTYIKENEKLKAENEELKEQIDGDTFWGISIGLKKELSNSHKKQNSMIKQIVKLKEENKRLGAQNEKLKEENEHFEKACDGYEDILAGEKGLIDQNEELKQFALAVHNFAFGTEWDDEDIVSAMGFDGIIEKMKNDEKGEMDENKKLKAENKKLNERLMTPKEMSDKIDEVLS